jgi:GT2 family glycosyltransferase
MTNENKVTVVCTSFNRPDLLAVTLRSFHLYNDYPIAEIIVQDDSGVIGCNDHLKEAYPNVDFRYNQKRIGQIKSIDAAYSTVTTPYIFHMEEDWQFYQSGFIEASLDVLEDRSKVVCVWIRAEGDTNGHPTESATLRAGDSTDYKVMRLHHSRVWHGFTFNPSLRRLSDWKAHGGYSKLATFVPNQPWFSESKIGNYYMRKGFRAAQICGEGFVKHIGDNRGIRG